MILDFLFPVNCQVCGQPGKYFCNKCRRELRLLTRQICPICGQPSPLGFAHPTCQSKIAGLLSLYPYHSPVGQMIRDFKYQPAKRLARTLVKLTVQGLKKNKRNLVFWRQNNYVFLPVSLFPLKKLYRGFDQAEEVLAIVTQKLNLGYDSQILIRHRWTGQQTKLSSQERKKNVQAAFRVIDELKVKDQKFVLFDDVWTTGSTIKAAAAALKSAGADKIWTLTICR